MPRRAGSLLLLLAACGETGLLPDDAGVRVMVDIGFPDPAGPDAGPAGDAGSPDAGRVDAGAPGDRDGDGIPDSTDPSPGRANLALFVDRFEARQPDWLFTSDALGVDRGVLAFPAVDDQLALAWLGPRTTWGDLHVRARLRVRAAGERLQGGGRVGLIARTMRAIPPRAYACDIDARAGRLLLVELDGDATGAILAEAALDVPRNEWLQLDFTLEATGLRCTALGRSVEATSRRFISGAAGFRGVEASFDADDLEVYSL